jgi:hypothetical protein
VVELLLSIHKAQGSIPSTEKKKRKKERRKYMGPVHILDPLNQKCHVS